MKKYVNLELEVKFFEIADVITSSGNYSNYDGNPFGVGETDKWEW